MFSVIFPVVAGSVSAWLDKSVCSRCDSKFTLNKPCAVCKKPVCGGCGIDFGSMISDSAKQKVQDAVKSGIKGLFRR